MELDEAMRRLKQMADPARREAQARYGIDVSRSIGVSAPQLHRLAKEAGRSHGLAGGLWATGVHEARLLAALVDEPAAVDEDQMERWAADFTSWDVVDCTCCYLFDRTSFARRKAIEWSRRDEEFVKRAGFVLMACIAVHDKTASDDVFEPFFAAVVEQACDGRNFVRKAVSWALRQIGKRNLALRDRAVEVAEQAGRLDCRAARWVASDALRELRSPQLEARLTTRTQP